MRVPIVRAWGEGLLQKVADRLVGQTEKFNTVMLMDYIGSETIALVTLHHIPEEYQGVPLSQTGLKTNTGILVMLIESPGKKAVPVNADTVFAVDDKLTVFGNYSVICKTFHARERFADE